MDKIDRSKQIIGIAGEYYVAAELSRRQFSASITLRNNDNIDIHASKNGKTFAIQVKTSSDKRGTWILSSKAEKLKGETIFYVFVSMKGEYERPDYYIVPSNVVADYTETSHKNWLERPGKKGTPHKDSSMRNFKDKVGIYKERWELLK